MLERTLTLTDLTLFGLISIMGSGGFNLIGKGMRNGGSMWPVALAVASMLIMGAAYAYAGAHDRFMTNTSEADMIHTMFGESASNVGTGAILVYNIVSIVVILVFCTQMIIPSSSWLSQVCMTIGILGSMAGLSLLGIDVNKAVIDVLGWILIAVLGMIAIIGGVGLATRPLPSVPLPSWSGFMESLWMFFFILVGFDALMKFSEETKDSADIPRSFYAANGVSIGLTITMAIAVLVWIPKLTESNDSMAIEHMFANIFGDWILEPTKWMVIMFLLSTTFVVFLATTRFLYGLGDSVDWLAPMKAINDANAPWKAIIAVFCAGSTISVLNNIEMLVKITDLGFAVIAALVAGAVSAADAQEGKVESAAINGLTGAGYLGLLASAFV